MKVFSATLWQASSLLRPSLPWLLPLLLPWPLPWLLPWLCSLPVTLQAWNFQHLAHQNHHHHHHHLHHHHHHHEAGFHWAQQAFPLQCHFLVHLGNCFLLLLTQLPWNCRSGILQIQWWPTDAHDSAHPNVHGMGILIAGCKTRSHNAEVITAMKSCHGTHDLLAADAQGYCVTAVGHARVGANWNPSMHFFSMRHMRAFFLQTRKTLNTPEGFWY